MRIVIDGTVSAGKTTLIAGISQRNPLRRLEGLIDLGTPIFTDWIIDVIAEMRAIGYEDPADNWPLFFKMAVDKSIDNYYKAEPDTVNFYDRSIHFLEIMAARYGMKLPNTYYDFCKDHRYDNPVFILEPILSVDATTPHPSDNKQKIYTIEQRIKQHNDAIELYKRWGYEVIVLPLSDSDPVKSQQYRFEYIKEVLNL